MNNLKIKNHPPSPDLRLACHSFVGLPKCKQYQNSIRFKCLNYNGLGYQRETGWSCRDNFLHIQSI